MSGGPDASEGLSLWVEYGIERGELLAAIGSLNVRERRIIELRYGFDGEPLTREAIGRDLGVSAMRVRHLEGWALRHLREAISQNVGKSLDVRPPGQAHSSRRPLTYDCPVSPTL